MPATNPSKPRTRVVLARTAVGLIAVVICAAWFAHSRMRPLGETLEMCAKSCHALGLEYGQLSPCICDTDRPWPRSLSSK